MRLKTIAVAAVPVIVGVIAADWLSSNFNLFGNIRNGQIK